MRRRTVALMALLALAFASASAPAADPLKPRNGLYQGGTGQTKPIKFEVRGRDRIEELFFASEFGTCDSTTTASLSGGKPISRRGRFRIDLPFGDDYSTTIRGRFFEKTKARGRIVFTDADASSCGVAEARTRFRVTRTPRL